jgi:hypothetical protein
VRRILVLAPLPFEQIAALASDAVQVVVGSSGETMFELRRQSRELDNVMVVPADPPVIPWVDAFFSEVIATSEWPEAEIQRVSQAGASIRRENG